MKFAVSVLLAYPDWVITKERALSDFTPMENQQFEVVFVKQIVVK